MSVACTESLRSLGFDLDDDQIVRNENTSIFKEVTICVPCLVAVIDRIIIVWSMKVSVLLILACVGAQSQTYYATTVAGANHGVNGVPATSVPLSNPIGLALDGVGNLYVADEGQSRVRRITPQGLAYTFAGTGSNSVPGPVSGPLASTPIPQPSLVAVDNNQNTFIFESGYGLIMRVTPAGFVEPYAGLICTDSPCTTGPEGGSATRQIIYPYALATDSVGNLFIASTDCTIHKVDTQGNMTTIAGTGVFGFSGDGGPAVDATVGQYVGLATDPSGNLYLADSQALRVRIINTAGMITTITGPGLYNTGYNPPFLNPMAIAYFSGSLYIVDGVDGDNNLVIQMDLSDNSFKTIPYVAGPPLAYAAAINPSATPPTAIAVDSSGIYILDSFYRRIRRVRGDETTTFAGAESLGDKGAAISAFLEQPAGIAIAGSTIYVADVGNNYVRRISSDLKISGVNGTQYPYSLAAAGSGDLFIDTAGAVIEKFANNGTKPMTIAGGSQQGFSGDGGPAIDATLTIYSLASDQAGNLFVGDGARIRMINASSGIISTIAGTGIWGDTGDGGLALDAEIDNSDVAVDDKSNLYFADGEGRIREINVDGIITTIGGAGKLGYVAFGGDGGPAIDADFARPTGVAVDKTGNVYIADSLNYRVRKITTDGVINTIAGTGEMAPWTDDGPALEANLFPNRLTVDDFGNVYVSDQSNDRVIRLSPVIPGSSLAATGGNGQSADAFAQLPAPISVKVVDATGAGIAGVPITFTVTPESAATFSPAWMLTAADGTAYSVVTLGGPRDAITLSATAPGLLSVTFVATAHLPIRIHHRRPGTAP